MVFWEVSHLRPSTGRLYMGCLSRERHEEASHSRHHTEGVRESLPESSLPESSLPESSLPESSLPESSLPESSFPECHVLLSDAW